MDLSFLVKMTRGEERVLMKAFAILSSFVYSVFWLYVPQFRTADLILRSALLASAVVAILYFERGLFGAVAIVGIRQNPKSELMIPLSLYIGPIVTTSVFLILTRSQFSSGIGLPLFYWILVVPGITPFVRKIARDGCFLSVEETNKSDEKIRDPNKRGQKPDVLEKDRDRKGNR